MTTTKGIIVGLGVLFVMFIAMPAGLNGQDVEPDLQVKSSDISFSPSSPVKANTFVAVHANIRNVGNCYIVLSDNNVDEIGFDHDFEQGDFIKVKVIVRSPDNGNVTKPIEFQARIGNEYSTIQATYNENWEEKDLLNLTVPVSGNDRLYIKRVSGAGYDLEIDRIVIYHDYDKYKQDWDAETTREGESYDAGGDQVDWIHPSDVQVKFYDGDPASGGSQIGGAKTVGNVQKTTESGSVKILTEGGKASTQVVWQARPLGWHKIYVDITPDPREEVTNNNKAYKSIEVISPLWIILEYFLKPHYGK